ncbi:outer membrane beta-barrel protein [Sphingobacterium sp. SGG-5]|uniref:TonB-dependent receptor n=1 Tax=Sphingobacterium sp. SGG-5 TaxID=2710881 RepID=UPI0013EBEE21|nr:TonB-dependent receptor [Sphingobacterium sp. SGG-5]NGM62169.1 outer membrane beta-barrel protein [Sphingobacterium sp. SGG-5]
MAVLIICVLGDTLFAQNSIGGSVQDTSGNPLAAVSVRLTTDQDTFSCVTDTSGRYIFEDVGGHTVFLTFSMLGYEVGYQSMFLLEENNHVEVPEVRLEPMFFTIKGVNVVRVLPLVVTEDTIQFNFDAYKFRPNSLLEEAIKKLPGFHVARDGSVYYNGKAIRRAKVDNKDFFGGNLLTATKNLPAGFIQNLQVIDDYGPIDEVTGSKHDKPEKIINITLKPDRKQIYFGQMTMGGGTNDRYLGSLGLNKFDDGREISLNGSINNTNTNMVYLGGLAGMSRERSLLDIGDYADPVDGLNHVSAVGINLSDRLGKRFSVQTSYNFSRKRNITDGFSQLTSSYIGNTITRKEDYTLETNDFNHSVKFGVEGKFANKDELKIHGNLAFNKQRVYNEKTTKISNANTKNIGSFQDTTELTTPNGDLDVFYSKFFARKGRKFAANLSLQSNTLKRDETFNERYIEFVDAPDDIDEPPYLQNQLINQNNVTNSANLALTYTEPFMDYGRFEFNYLFDITGIDAVRLVYNRLNPTNPSYIDSLAVDYDYYYKNNRFGLNYQYESGKTLKVNVGFAVEPIVLTGNLALEGMQYTYENINLIPTANVWYKLSKDLDWQIDYRGKNNQPNFNQIAPVVDNSNSRNVIIGNPELKAEFAHRISTRIRKSIPSKAQYLETNFAYNVIMDKIVSDKTSLSSSTIQQTTFQNTSGYYDMRWFYVFNTPFITDDLQLDLTGNTDYFNHPSYIDNRKRITKQLMVNQSLQLRYTLSDYLESGFIANYNLNNAKYDIPFRTHINVHTWQWGMNTKTYLGEHFSVGTELSQRYNEGYTANFMNINQTVINGFIEYTFLPNKTGLLRLQGFDLLDQNKNMGIYSEYIGNDVYEARNNRLGRYFMLSLNIRIQKYPKK